MPILISREDDSLYYGEPSDEEIREQERISNMSSFEYAKYQEKLMFN